MASFRQRNDAWRAEISVFAKVQLLIQKHRLGLGPQDSITRTVTWKTSGPFIFIERYLNEVSIKKKTHENEEWLSLNVSIRNYAKNSCHHWRFSPVAWLPVKRGAGLRREANILASLFTVARKEGLKSRLWPTWLCRHLRNTANYPRWNW